MSKQPNLTYADGSANRYEISTRELRYLPIKPEESSTGTYSGGQPAQVGLNEEQYNRLRSLFEMAIAQPDQQIPDRIKTSGLVVVGNKQANLKPGSALMLEIESALQNLLGR
ncbi:MAG: hypothetical protein KF763_03465 [Cyclobacteriaceae bacterium]|nr:hypothetical protein [Cyclobacteriaceae bacterium]